MEQQFAPVAAPAPDALGPTRREERISSLDILRGVALLGILPMNIIALGLHPAAYGDPSVHGGAAGRDLWAFAFNSVMFDGKMRGIFSLLFGAGVILLTARAERRGHAAEMADIYYRRLLWLLVFGILHAFLLWFGDILYPYALMGLMLYPFRKLSPRGLFVFGGVFAFGVTLFMLGDAMSTRDLRMQVVAANAVVAAGDEPTTGQQEALDGWEERLEMMKPPAEAIEETVEAYRSGFVGATKERAHDVLMWHALPYWHPWNWDLLMMMLFGMAFFKLGILSGKRSYRLYATMALVGYAVGLPLSVWLVREMIAAEFDLVGNLFAMIVYEPARVAVFFGHFGLLMILIKAGLLPLARPLAAVGQMALSNYVLQSVLCNVVFVGGFVGFGLFGRLGRFEIYWVVLGIWAVNLICSPLWLRRYRFGPLEWLWRSLTYWKPQPLRR